jgi:hypothetical protein
MPYGRTDVYCDAEKFGLTQVDEIDLSDGCYQFDLVVVWKHEDGKHYWANDSGCSCPSPFELYTTLDQLTPLVSDHDMMQLIKMVDGDSPYSQYTTVEERAKFINTVRESMRS